MLTAYSGMALTVALGLDDPVADHLPPDLDFDTTGITIRHLLAHVSGLKPSLSQNPPWSGYDTAIFGKWHLGNSPGRLPTDQGFDHWWGFLTGAALFGLTYDKVFPPISKLLNYGSTVVPDLWNVNAIIFALFSLTTLKLR